MIVCTALATCRQRSWLDWTMAICLDLLTIAWIAALIAWWL